MDPHDQQDVKTWNESYCEAVYAVIVASRAVAVTQKDWQVIAAQCESIRGYRDADEIGAEALILLEQSAHEPDLDLLLDEQIKQRNKKQKRILIASVVGVILCVNGGTAAILFRNAQRKQFLAELSQHREILDKYAPRELIEVEYIVDSQGYQEALDRLRQAAVVAINREQSARQEEEVKRREEERKRKALEEAERQKKAAEAERRREELEAERVRALAEAARQQQIREAEQKRLAEEADRLRRIEEEKILDAQRRLAEAERQKQAQAEALRRAEIARQEAELSRRAALERQAQIFKGLASAKSALEAKQWKQLLGLATEVLALDKTNREAAEYKQAAEFYLDTPFVTLIATVDGKDLPAQAVLDKTYTTPVTLPLVNGGIYQVVFKAAQGGRSYQAQLRLPVAADWKGERTVRVELHEVSRPVAGKDWVSPSTGMAFVWIDALKIWVGKYEVTNAEYRKKHPMHNSKSMRDIQERVYSLNEERQPVVFVNFNEAKEYAQWLSRLDGTQIEPYQYRLPTEKEFTDLLRCGVFLQTYPWGEAWPPPTGQAGNYDDEKEIDTFSIENYRDGSVATCAVEQSGKNAWGLFGVGGNVWECCLSDLSTGEFGAWRGASWADASSGYLKCDFNNSGKASMLRNEESGFRLILSP